MEPDMNIDEPEESDEFIPFLNSQADFEAFVWGKPKRKANTFSQTLRYATEDSYVFKTFKNEFETDHLFSPKSVEKIKRGLINLTFTSDTTATSPYIHNRHFLPLDSSLTRPEMARCYECYIDICANKKLTGLKLRNYEDFKKKIEEEQASFLTLTRNIWFGNNISQAPSFIKPEVVEYTSKLWKERLTRLNWYPNSYSKSSDIALNYDSENITEFKFVSNLKYIGNSPFAFIPLSKNNEVNIYSKTVENDNSFLKDTSCSYKPIHSVLLQKGYHPEVSKDSLAESLAATSNAQVVMSSSAFLHLFNIHQETATLSWDLPIVIKQLDDVNRKVVFIDKALPPKVFSAAQRNKLYFKKKIDSVLRSMRTVSRNRKQVDYSDDCDVYDISKLEKFGIDSPGHSQPLEKGVKKKPSKRKISNGVSRTEDRLSTEKSLAIKKSNFNAWSECISADDSINDFSDEGSISANDHDDNREKKSDVINDSIGRDSDSAATTEDELVIDMDENEAEAPTPKKLPFKLPQKEENSPSLEKHVKTEQNSSTESFKKPLSEPPLKTDYNLFSLKCETESLLLKTNLKNLNVIIRSKSSSKLRNKGKVINHVTTTKPEYQPCFGAEVLSLNEISQDWSRLFIRPDSQLLRVRLDPLTGNIIMYEKKNLQDITLDFSRLYGINPHKKLTNVHSILDQIYKQPPGKYLLSYKTESKLFAYLYKEDNRNSSVSLSLDYINVDHNDVAATYHNYLDIDKMVITPQCEFFKKIPATFCPKGKRSSKLKHCEPQEKKIPVKNKKKKSKKKKKITTKQTPGELE